MKPDDEEIIAFLCPEDDGSFCLEMFDQEGSWIMTIRHTKEKNLMADFNEIISKIPREEFTPGWIPTARRIIRRSMKQIPS